MVINSLPSTRVWGTLTLPSFQLFVKLRNRAVRACLSLVFVLLVVAGWCAIAQESSSKDAPAQGVPAKELPVEDAPKTSRLVRPHRRARLTLDDQVKVFAQKLELNERQQLAVKKILEQRQMETLRLRQDSSISGEERIDRFRALQDRTVSRIRSVLTDDQRKKYDPLAVRRVPTAPDQRSVDDWLKDITPK